MCVLLQAVMAWVGALYTPNSKNVALGIGNWALGNYCLAVTQAKLFFVSVCPNAQSPIPNDQLPKQLLLN